MSTSITTHSMADIKANLSFLSMDIAKQPEGMAHANTFR